MCELGKKINKKENITTLIISSLSIVPKQFVGYLKCNESIIKENKLKFVTASS